MCVKLLSLGSITMASTTFADVLESVREAGTSRFSATSIADALDLPHQDLAALAGVHRNTLRTHPESARLQAALRGVLGAMVLAQGHTGILFPSQSNRDGTNVVVYVDRLKDGNTVEVNDPDGRLPRDESSWKR
jgi:RES domain-containing protein